MAKTLGDHVRRNTRVALISMLWTQGLNFLLVPIMFNRLQEDGYGLWRFAFVVIFYFSVYNVGINSALVKFTAEHHNRKDYKNLSALLSTGMTVGLLLGVCVVSFLYFAGDWLVGFFDKVKPENAADAVFALQVLSLVTASTLSMGVFQAALTGVQRVDIRHYCRLVFTTIDFVVRFYLLYNDYGVRAVIICYAACNIGGTIVMGLFLRRQLPEVHINPLRARFACLRPMFGTGGRMIFLGVIAMVVGQFDIVALTRYEGFAFVGAYGAAKALAERVANVPGQGFGPLVPASADLHARDDHGKLALMYASSLRICCVVCVYFFAFMFINSDLIIKGYLDIRESNYLSILALNFMCLAVFVHTLTGPGSSMLRGPCQPGYEIFYQILTLVIFLPLLHFAQSHGLFKLVVLSFAASRGLASLVFLLFVNRHFKASIIAPFDRTLIAIASGLLLAWAIRIGWDYTGRIAYSTVVDHTAAFRILLISRDIDLLFQRLACIAGVITMGLIYSPLFAFAVWRLPGLTARDKEQLVKFVPFGRAIKAKLEARRAAARANLSPLPAND